MANSYFMEHTDFRGWSFEEEYAKHFPENMQLEN
jgi:hypothetical protein